MPHKHDRNRLLMNLSMGKVQSFKLSDHQIELPKPKKIKRKFILGE